MTTLIVTATGIGQRKNGRISNALLDEHLRISGTQGVEAIHTTWRDNASSLADYIADKIQPTRIILAGHSKGGDFVNDVAWAMEQRGFYVDAMVLLDAWNRMGLIVVPSTVRELYSFRQSQNRPRGVEIELSEPDLTKWVVNEMNVPCGHLGVDEYAISTGLLRRLVGGE